MNAEDFFRRATWLIKMPDMYFSDREFGERSRDLEKVSARAWGGIVASLRSLVINGAFGLHFPKECVDGKGTVGTDEHALYLGMQAEIPKLSQFPEDSTVPDTQVVFDLLEFCFEVVAKPSEVDFHEYFGHTHLRFDERRGRKDFRKKVNQILARNGIAYELTEHGRVERLIPGALGELLRKPRAVSGDIEVDKLVEVARTKLVDPDENVRRESLEKLWDAFERVKTILPGKNKKQSAERLLSKATREPKWQRYLEDEADVLTNIGNTFRIRHSETTQTQLPELVDVDYAFHRMYAFLMRVIHNLND